MGDKHPVRDAGLAISLLSMVPSRATWPDDGRTEVASWFPAVGALFGVAGYAVAKLGYATGANARAPYVMATVIVVVWAVGSRLLHWDGLADVSDAFWGSHDRERRLEIMSDSHTGAFGATVVTLVAVLEVASIGAILAAPHELPLLCVPIIGRFSATAAAWLGTPARPDGLGRSVIGRPTALGLIVCVVPLAAALVALWVGLHGLGIALGTFGLLVAFATPHVLAQRFGGVTGDVMGASVLFTEAVLFAAIALTV